MKTALITGGSRGIGSAIALALGKNFHVIVGFANSKDNANDVVEEIIAAGGSASTVQIDISNSESVDNAFLTVEKEYNSVDVLINNAGIGERKTIEELTIDSFMKVFNVNVFGLALFTKQIVPVMKINNGGTIINIGSTASLKGYQTGSIYASSKFAVRCLTQCWQAELRPHNIRVCQINPSEVTTAFGRPERIERDEVHNKLTSKEIAHAITSAIEMDDRGFINELNVWATNPF